MDDASYPRTPDSATVGKPGASADGCSLPIASARNLPDLMCVETEPSGENIMCTSPPSSAMTEGPVPLYGTRTSLTPAMDLNISIARCVEAPMVPAA